MTVDYFEESALIYGGAGLLISVAVLWLVNGSLVKRGILVLENNEKYLRNRTLQKRCISALVIMAVVTFLVETVVLKGWDVIKLAEYTEFHDCESFVALMEKRVSTDSWMENQVHSNAESSTDSTITEPGSRLENVENLPQYYDKYGHPISEEEALRRELLDEDGNVLCTYLQCNESVVHWETQKDRDGNLVIRVVDQNQLRAAHEKGNKIVFVFGVLYAVEAAGTVLIYLLRRERQKS